MDFAHGAIQLTTGAIGTTFVVSGLSFQPKAIRFYWTGIDSATDAVTGAVNERRGVGFASSTSSRRTIASFSQDTAGTSNCGGGAANDCCVATTDGAGAFDGKIDISAFASDGFTLIVDDVLPAAMTLFWEAWGGADITNVTIGDIAEPAATGTQNYTATGFTSADNGSQVVMLAGCQSTAAVNTAAATDSGFFTGFTSGSGEQCVVSGNSDDASTAMDTDGVASGGRCLTMCALAGGTEGSRAAFSAWGTDLFTLNWTTVLTTNRRSIYMAIKGGAWRAGDFPIEGQTLDDTSAISSLPMSQLRGICFLGNMAAANSSFGAHDRISLGTATGTGSRRAMGQMDENATASSACEIGTAVEYDQILVYTGTSDTVITRHDVSVFGTNNFTVIVDTAGGVTNECIGYLAFGDAVAGISIPIAAYHYNHHLKG